MDGESVTRGTKIRAARERRGWRKATLARRAGVAPSYVTKLEAGTIGRPSLEYLGKIASALGVAVIDLDGRPRAEPPPDIAAKIDQVRRKNPRLADALIGKLADVPDDLYDAAVGEAAHAVDTVLRLSRR